MLTLGAYGEGFDFYDLKGTVEAILRGIRAEDIHFEGSLGAPSDASYHPGRFAAVWCGTNQVGVMGQIHPNVAKNFGVDGELYCAELSFDSLYYHAMGADPEYVPLPKFALFDIYRGKGIDEGKKSVAFNLVLRSDEGSLTSEEADEDVRSILETLKEELGAVLR